MSVCLSAPGPLAETISWLVLLLPCAALLFLDCHTNPTHSTTSISAHTSIDSFVVSAQVGALGVATAMQVLLGAEGRGGDSSRLHRVEIAALLTTLGKFASAVQIVTEFEERKRGEI